MKWLSRGLLAGLLLPLSGCQIALYPITLVSCALRAQPTLSPEALPLARVGQPYQAQITLIASSSPVSGFYAEPLPPGLTLQHQGRRPDATLVGTPQREGVYHFVVSVGAFGTQCAGLSADREYRLEVK
ncbi:hypothetical protein [Pseudomonas donghuensis]|uniref:Lipoprotein n=1 Tax=Pseudomonas donghuensis TaxID=1163398 RepID=A0AAP0XD03_9PSED|nr:hypothetical protein [Pseudomonas donghuensis]KDO02020.2 hypothetical protein BV82_0155 [Pseudomonas donghuensis]MCP6693463.1 hypothetical protein [Pseudomonas donghuensis]MDF9891731.1 hypothetical protein [Pseudomonas vranovensis]